MLDSSLCFVSFFYVAFWEIMRQKFCGFGPESTRLNIGRWHCAAMNGLIGDDLMDFFYLEVFLEHYEWQANPTPCSLSSPWARTWNASQIFHVNLLAMLCDPKQTELHAYLL